jgi:hypothetical protein
LAMLRSQIGAMRVGSCRVAVCGDDGDF